MWQRLVAQFFPKRTVNAAVKPTRDVPTDDIEKLSAGMTILKQRQGLQERMLVHNQSDNERSLRQLNERISALEGLVQTQQETINSYRKRLQQLEHRRPRREPEVVARPTLSQVVDELAYLLGPQIVQSVVAIYHQEGAEGFRRIFCLPDGRLRPQVATAVSDGIADLWRIDTQFHAEILRSWQASRYYRQLEREVYAVRPMLKTATDDLAS